MSSRRCLTSILRNLYKAKPDIGNRKILQLSADNYIRSVHQGPITFEAPMCL